MKSLSIAPSIIESSKHQIIINPLHPHHPLSNHQRITPSINHHTVNLTRRAGSILQLLLYLHLLMV